MENSTEVTILLPDKAFIEEDGKGKQYDIYKPNIEMISIEFSDIYELY